MAKKPLLWVFPIISITVWLGKWHFPVLGGAMAYKYSAMLLAMLIHWCVIGKPFYVSEDPHQRIA